jgi:DNA repair exonuclease SbcCD ATPase subunit
MRLPRFRAIRLSYGCHSRRFDLPDEARPVVISGPNGSGKTTLLEAFLRTLYGFSRRKPEERRRLELRHPWSGQPVKAEADLVCCDGETISVSRDFETDEVIALETATDVEVFRGDGNPVGVRSESRHYQELVRGWIGFALLEPYRRTAWIGQGELVDTRLDDELLRAAAGSHRKVEAALDELREDFDRLTREPIELGGRRKNRLRQLEELRDSSDGLAGRLEAARSARERRRPLRDEVAGIRERIDELEAQIALLETAYRPLSERRTLIAEEKQAAERLSAVSDALRWLRDADREVTLARAEAEAAEAAGVYPDDLESRLGQARALWNRRAELEAEVAELSAPATDAFGAHQKSGPSRTLVPAGAILCLGSILLAATVSSSIALAAGAAGMLLIAGGLWRGRGGTTFSNEAMALRLGREREALAATLSDLAVGIPGLPLTSETIADHQRHYRAQQRARAAESQTRSLFEEAAQRAWTLVREAASSEAEVPDAVPLIRHLEEGENEARTALARIQLRMEEQPAVPELPSGVEPSVAAVDKARAERRTERDDLAGSSARIDLELRDLERASEDALALERELARTRDIIAQVEADVQVRRKAWELVRDAYGEFRDRDQDRLLGAVNQRLQRLSGGSLGPIRTETDLGAAHVMLGEREVAVDSPPLSYGEKHVTLLAIRLGAADFLAGDGVRHPLLVDEPFTHLDEIRSREVWELLCELARDRQVIVTTQDRLVLEHLGVTADIELTAADDAAEGEPTRSLRGPPGTPVHGERAPESMPVKPHPESAAPVEDDAEGVPSTTLNEQAQLELG